MTKQTQKDQIRNNRFTLIIASAALILSLMSVFAIWNRDQNMKFWDESNFKNDMERNTRQARFEFCYNNNIRPCDDISLKEFNELPENKASENIFPIP
jgi:hypothetical protein